VKLAVVVGARPNFVKLAALSRSLREWSEVVVIHTGQHYDDAMSARFFSELEMPAPDIDLGVGSGTHSEQTARIMLGLEPVLVDVAPDLVVLVGDVNSTLAGALVAVKLRRPIAHVEAGLRSGDRGMPEEINRRLVDHVSDLLFAPSSDAVDNLAREGIEPRTVHLVGNVMIDTLVEALPKARARADEIRQRFSVPNEFMLLTLHRPETVDDPETFAGVMGAIVELATDHPVVFPVHPRVGERARQLSTDATNLVLTEPLGYLDFIALEDTASVVVTDSGGVQEETSFLGVPCVTTRLSTERPITCTHGTNRLAGYDRERIVTETRAARAHARQPAEIPLWDGRTAPRISKVMRAQLEGAVRS
jgi:UDP-N-acetylglucosamine 2-epimerase (non-hydrolysing)